MRPWRLFTYWTRQGDQKQASKIPGSNIGPFGAVKRALRLSWCKHSLCTLSIPENPKLQTMRVLHPHTKTQPHSMTWLLTDRKFVSHALVKCKSCPRMRQSATQRTDLKQTCPVELDAVATNVDVREPATNQTKRSAAQHVRRKHDSAVVAVYSLHLQRPQTTWLWTRYLQRAYVSTTSWQQPLPILVTAYTGENCWYYLRISLINFKREPLKWYGWKLVCWYL